MSHKHKVMLEKIFAHPIATSLDWKKLSSALKHYGAEIDLSHSNRAHISFGKKELVIGMPHQGKELKSKADVMKLRHFLEELEISL